MKKLYKNYQSVSNSKRTNVISEKEFKYYWNTPSDVVYNKLIKEAMLSMKLRKAKIKTYKKGKSK